MYVLLLQLQLYLTNFMSWCEDTFCCHYFYLKKLLLTVFITFNFISLNKILMWQQLKYKFKESVNKSFQEIVQFTWERRRCGTLRCRRFWTSGRHLPRRTPQQSSTRRWSSPWPRSSRRRGSRREGKAYRWSEERMNENVSKTSQKLWQLWDKIMN